MNKSCIGLEFRGLWVKTTYHLGQRYQSRIAFHACFFRFCLPIVRNARLLWASDTKPCINLWWYRFNVWHVCSLTVVFLLHKFAITLRCFICPSNIMNSNEITFSTRTLQCYFLLLWWLLWFFYGAFLMQHNPEWWKREIKPAHESISFINLYAVLLT